MTSGKRARQPTPLSGEAADVAAHIAKGRIPEPVRLDRDETIKASATVHTDHRVVLLPGWLRQHQDRCPDGRHPPSGLNSSSSCGQDQGYRVTIQLETGSSGRIPG